jgi:isoquinoline 1-oxidoreductase beta subunit
MTMHTPQVSRRTFLKTSALVSGGLMLGVSLPMLHKADDNTITLLSARSEMGQGVYTSMPMLIAEELHVDLGSVNVAIATPGKDYVNALLGAQITGGSTSVRDGWEKLRVAGAQVREMLISAAADKFQVDRSTLKADNGVITTADGRSATYGELAEAASKLPVPENVVLRDPKDFRIVGRPTKRLDTPAKVNGTAEFGIDVHMPGMLYASMVQCPVIGGTVKSFDASVAKSMPGVVDVVQLPDGVAVVADRYWRAKKARDTLKVEWDEGSVASISNASMRAAIKEASEGDKFISIKSVGDAKTAMQSGVKVIKASYEMPLQAHAPMEPMNFTAYVHDGKCTLSGPTQFQQGAAGAVAAAIGVKPEDITLHTTFLGGGFGRRLELDFIVQSALISKAVGRPVKLLWTREDDMTHDFYRPMALNQVTAAVDAKGMPVALWYRVTSQSVTQRAFGLPKDTLDPFMAEAAVAPYNIANATHELVIHDTGLRAGYWRAVSHNMNAFANESFVDELAHAAKADPVAYRMALLEGKPRFQNVLSIAAKTAGWDKPRKPGEGRGVALMEGYDTYMCQVADVTVKQGEVTVNRVVVVADLGHMVNPDTVKAQIESSIAFGMSSALYQEVTLENGRVQQTNFHNFRPIRMNQMPKVDIVLIESTEKPGGIGEPATALVGPALANAIFAATGKRVRHQPISPDAILKA